VTVHKIGNHLGSRPISRLNDAPDDGFFLPRPLSADALLLEVSVAAQQIAA
jgi:hypothetical protein